MKFAMYVINCETQEVFGSNDVVAVSSYIESREDTDLDSFLILHSTTGDVQQLYGDAEAIQALPYTFFICYISDGSTDRTNEILRDLACSDERITAIELSRNFGHQPAITAGIDCFDIEISERDPDRQSLGPVGMVQQDRDQRL